MRAIRRIEVLLPCVLLALLAAACFTLPPRASQHSWRPDLGPVLPHDTFPAQCELCHVPDNWQRLRDDFTFDHEAQTGYALSGAHNRANCLRCHNDRGPVQDFEAKGCVGCHEDLHQGQLGPNCTSCHQTRTWLAVGQRERHSRTRFPLIGIHASVSCHRCHPGAEVGKFVPTDTECVTCHRVDLLGANNPNHINLGLVDRCDRCHIPTNWNMAELGN